MNTAKTLNIGDLDRIPALILRNCMILLFSPALFFFLNCCSAKGNIKSVPAPSGIAAPLPRENDLIAEDKKTNAPGNKETGKITGEIDSSSPLKEDISQTGIASWYGADFHGRRTAAGEIYDMNKLTAAHRELPFNTIVEVENIENGKRTPVRINDRGPFIKGRIIDLSYKAAQRLGLAEKGTAPVNLRIIDPGKPAFQDSGSPQDEPDKYEETNSSDPADPDKDEADCYIQAGAFADEQNARLMLQRLETALPRVFFKIDFQDGFFKVTSGQAFSRDKAGQYKSILESCGIDIFIKVIKVNKVIKVIKVIKEKQPD